MIGQPTLPHLIALLFIPPLPTGFVGQLTDLIEAMPPDHTLPLIALFGWGTRRAVRRCAFAGDGA